MFSGADLFALKATRGLPLEMAVDIIMNDKKRVINWPEFIEAARASGWYDFQTYKNIIEALEDAQISREVIAEISKRLKLYILKTL